MSDPNNPVRQTDINQTDLPPAESMPRKSASPLIWLVLLIALLALGWYLYNRSQIETEVPVPLPSATMETPTPAEPAPAPQPRAERAPDRAQPNRTARMDSDAQPLSQPKPTYPIAALRSRDEGTVMVRVDVDASGNPTNAVIAHRSGSRELDRAALDAVRKWRFKPAMHDGKAVVASVQVPVEFKLDEQR